MKITYELVQVYTGDKMVLRHNEDGTTTSIPTDPANSDYQAYLKSLDEASTL
jgi:hypothetical protein